MPEWLRNLAGNIAGGVGDVASGLLGLFYNPDTGEINYQNIITALGAYGISRADDSSTLSDFFGTSTPQPTGYTGGIPQYEYKREVLPEAFAQTYTRPATEEGGLPTVVPRRPGSGGRYYFTQGTYQPKTTELAGGGLASLSRGYYLGGPTDGMADLVPATIDGTQPAALSDGEFVIPADVVSHLGNGNSEAGAQQLYSMMDRVRTERTGTTKQGPEINPTKMMPA